MLKFRDSCLFTGVLFLVSFVILLAYYCYFFFFSSRRRHTRLQGDWSSDVCSSDLAHLVVARAGAMTVSELCAWGKPSVLVPLPTAAADHQTFNARALANAGASVLLLEREFTPEAFPDRKSVV